MDRLVPDLYNELRALAHAHLRRERTGHTLGTTGLVHEAWLRLAKDKAAGPLDATHFFGIASATMRRVLVDYARKRRRAKRGGDTPMASFDEAEALFTETQAEELVVLDEALDRLARANPRASAVVVHTFFGGLSEDETAKLLGVSTRTVQRDWRTARAWLRKEVSLELGVAQRER